MLRTRLLLCTLAIAPALFAQLPDGSIAPDFSGTDLNGTTHHLYALLDAGYTVVLDFSATWCIPCWTYHSSGNLETLQENYGPNSAVNKVRVFMIESEPTNTPAQLYGPAFTGDHATASEGDWVTGTSYPIIDGTFIPNAYHIASVPTILMICPDRRITRVGPEPYAQLWARAQACPLPVAGTNAALVAYNGDPLVCDDVAANVSIQNMGTSHVTGLSIAMKENGATLHTVDWSGDLSTYQLEHVLFPSTALSDPEAITFELTQPDASAADNVLDPGLIAAHPVLPDVTFRLTLDHFCTETTWKLFNSAGAVVQQGGPYNCDPDMGGGPDAEQTYTYQWALPGDCYRMELYDQLGDGLASNYVDPTYTDGNWRLYDSSGDTVFQGEGDFGSLVRAGLNVHAPEGVQERTRAGSLLAAPNPASDEVAMSYALAAGGAVTTEVFDARGTRLLALTSKVGAGMQRERLDVSGLAPGVYIVRVRSMQGQRSCTIAVAR